MYTGSSSTTVRQKHIAETSSQSDSEERRGCDVNVYKVVQSKYLQYMIADESNETGYNERENRPCMYEMTENNK